MFLVNSIINFFLNCAHLFDRVYPDYTTLQPLLHHSYSTLLRLGSSWCARPRKAVTIGIRRVTPGRVISIFQRSFVQTVTLCGSASTKQSKHTHCTALHCTALIYFDFALKCIINGRNVPTYYRANCWLWSWVP